jgi:hypothetical protein
VKTHQAVDVEKAEEHISERAALCAKDCGTQNFDTGNQRTPLGADARQRLIALQKLAMEPMKCERRVEVDQGEIEMM